MPRRQRELGGQANPFPSRSLLASSARFKGGKAARIYVTDDREWQRRAYRHYRICGEARFAAQFFGHALAKSTLYVVSDPFDPKAPRLTEGPEVDVLHELFNGEEGQAAMLAAIGTHFTVAGECYLIGRKPQNDEEAVGDIWEIRSVLEVSTNGAKGKAAQWWIKTGEPGKTDIQLTDDDVVIRLWIPDPENSVRADSPFRSLLPILDEIEYLTRYVFAQASSRLGGAGVWLVPEEIEFPEPPQDPDKPVDAAVSKADSLMQLIAESILKPIEDPSNPAAKVPVIGTVPGEFIQNLKDGWITFWTELDSEAKGLRQEAIQRFALGMDLPPERILGMSSNLGTGGGSSNGVSHWGAWQIDEDTIKMHVEPMLEVVVQAITIQYERPALPAGSMATVRYDTTALRLRPDRSKESIELYNLGLIKGEVVVRENRFDTSDMMSPAERRTWLLVKVATNSATPDMVNSALRTLGVDLGPTGMQVPDMNEGRPPPSIEDHPVRELPSREDNAAALTAACDALVYRALERAGNRIRQVIRDAGGEKPQVRHSYEVHTLAPSPPKAASKLLDDAWVCAPQVLSGCGVDPDQVIPHLHGYVTSLLVSGQPHDRDAMVRYLESQK